MKPVLLVTLGGDIGTYAFQRAARDKYGWEVKVISKVVTTFFKYSSLAEWIIEPNIHQGGVIIDRLNEVAAAHPNHELVVMTNLDWHVRNLAQRRSDLDPRWHVPMCDLATFDRVSSKHAFAKICEDVGARTPRSLSVVFPIKTADAPATSAPGSGTNAVVARSDVARTLDEQGLEFPLIGKPSASADWFEVSFEGKKKIHHFESLAELEHVLDALDAAQYPSEFLVQEFVPGDETHMRSITAYRDSRGQVTLMAGGQVLLEEHTPGTLGIPAAILTGVDQDAFDSATRILNAADYFGYANFDYKVSSRTGENVFFEMNPRIGRNNHYVTSAGVNVVDAVARDLLPEHFAAANPGGDGELPATPTEEILYSVVPFRLLKRYLLDPALRAQVAAARKRSGTFHPLRYRGDASLKRRAYVRALDVRLALKYRQFYPKPTETGF